MTFYTDLRDGAVVRILNSKGVSATLRQNADSYDPATGINSRTPTDTSIRVAFVSASKAKDHFLEADLSRTFDQMAIVGASELATAGVTMKPGDQIIIGSETIAVVATAPVAPAGVAVIYKALVSRGTP